jgi:hypothetical protein
VRIALAPGHVGVAVGSARKETSLSEPGWAGALKALADQLADSRSGGRARVVLSHHFAPVYLLQAPSLRLSTKEMLGWTREQLVQQFGEAARGWLLAWQDEPPGEPFLVSTLAPDRLADLNEILRARGLRAGSVEPWLAEACRRHRRVLGRGATWLALAEPGRLTLARLQRGHFRTLRSAQIGTEPARDLADMLAREALLEADQAGGPVWLQSLHVRADWQTLAGRIELRQLSPFDQGLAPLLGA